MRNNLLGSSNEDERLFPFRNSRNFLFVLVGVGHDIYALSAEQLTDEVEMIAVNLNRYSFTFVFAVVFFCIN